MDWNEVIQWNAVYDILVATCGAPEPGREDFLSYEGNFREYRFQGVLGFGGKIWKKADGALYVTCSPEDETAERRAMITEADQRLALVSLGARGNGGREWTRQNV